MSKRVVVCMSGGVDSTVAAYLLQQQGYEVEGITFSFWSFSGAPHYLEKAGRCLVNITSLAARELEIPHHTIDASAQFYDLVLRDFVERSRLGETPNPCGRCNRYLRFDLALHYAAKHGFDRVATGHHVQIVKGEDERLHLCQGGDSQKDQSYFLYGLKAKDLDRLVFPVGGMTKEEVFAIADAQGLLAASLPESQDLCFVQAGRADFLFSSKDLTPGPIIDRQGHILGEHKGLPFYTVGQRRGLGVTARQALYVIAIDKTRNALIVGQEEGLYTSSLVAREGHFLSGEAMLAGSRVSAKIRYRSPAYACTFRPLDNERFSIDFDEPQRAITPGQIVAIYDGARLLGGGIIE